MGKVNKTRTSQKGIQKEMAKRDMPKAKESEQLSCQKEKPSREQNPLKEGMHGQSLNMMEKLVAVSHALDLVSHSRVFSRSSLDQFCHLHLNPNH